MIKKLRRKFIIVAMVSVFAVLAIIISLINTVNYVNAANDADEVIEIIASQNGKLPETGELFKSDEAIYRIRYFTVVITEEDETIINTSYIASVTTEEAESYAQLLYSKNKTSGYYKDFRYAAKNATVNYTIREVSAVMFIFFDCAEQIDSFNSFLIASILISFAGLAVIFILVYFLSYLAVKPMAESYEKQKRFITDAGHELKTPLTIIDANTEVLEMTGGENEWTESIRNQVKRLTSMTEKLVFLSRMDEGDNKTQMTDFSLSDAVTEVAQYFKTLVDTRGKKLIVNVESNITYCGNEGEIRQLLSLLLDNAVKYSNENGTIEVTLRSTGKNKELVVKNTVDEIEQGRHDELFERFYRSDKSHNSESGGHGIGLSVAKAITERHNGKIIAKSDDGKSLTFTATL